MTEAARELKPPAWPDEGEASEGQLPQQPAPSAAVPPVRDASGGRGATSAVMRGRLPQRPSAAFARRWRLSCWHTRPPPSY
jgi:hypothetical protein